MPKVLITPLQNSSLAVSVEDDVVAIFSSATSSKTLHSSGPALICSRMVVDYLLNFRVITLLKGSASSARAAGMVLSSTYLYPIGFASKEVELNQCERSIFERHMKFHDYCGVVSPARKVIF